MAKRAEQLDAMAEDRQNKAQILVLRALRSFDVSIGDIRRVREVKPDGKEGRVIKQVTLLRCSCRVVGRKDPIERVIEMELPSDADYGFQAELEQCVAPALRQFIEHVKTTRLKEQAEAKEPLPGQPRPLPSDRTDADKSEARSQHMKALNAARNAARAAAAQQNAANQTTTPEGGES